MTIHSRPIFRDALSLVTVRLVAEQIGLALLVFGLFVLWLRVPDETVLELAASATLGVVVLGVACLGEAFLVLRIAGREMTTGRLIRGALLVILAVAIWSLYAGWTGHQVWDDPMRAGYLNSRLPRGLRYFFPFERILLFLEWMWSAVTWLGAGVLAAVVVVLTAPANPLRAAIQALKSASFWLVLLFGPTVAAICTNALMHWAPVHGLRREVISLSLRLPVAVLLDAVVTCCLLATLAVCVRRADAVYAPEGVVSGGGPDESQPRTAEAP
jgi:hypothetical protein